MAAAEPTAEVESDTTGRLDPHTCQTVKLVKGSQGFGMNISDAGHVTSYSSTPGLPAEMAGVIIGSRLVKVGGVAVQNHDDIVSALRATQLGDEVAFEMVIPEEQSDKMTLRLVTWNVDELNALSLDSLELARLLIGDFDRKPDIIVFGMQEVEMSGGALVSSMAHKTTDFVFGSTAKVETAKGQAWKTAISKALAPNKFYEVATLQMMGDVETTAVSCGAGLSSAVDSLKKETDGVALIGSLASGLSALVKSARDYMPETQNKGAVAVKLHNVRGRSIVLVSAHLAAGQKDVERRNADFHQIVRALRFGDATPIVNEETDAPVYRADYAFWLGDLNYRLDAGYDDVVRMAAESPQLCYEKLQQCDQLHLQRMAGNVFKGWEEASIQFAPTYKFDPNADIYDTSTKHRVPSFTDRLQWRCCNFGGTTSAHSSIEAVSYAAHMAPVWWGSDHRPVSADLVVSGFDSVAKIDLERLRQVLRPVALGEAPLAATHVQIYYTATAEDGSAGDTCGPMDCDTWLSQLKSMGIGPSTLVWVQGMQTWQAFRGVLVSEPSIAALAQAEAYMR